MIYCDNCEHSFNRDNVFGTFCPKCNCFIKPEKEPEFSKKNKEKKDNLKNKVLERIKNKLFGV